MSWLDAFIKPNSTDSEKHGVKGVKGVKEPRKPNEIKGLESLGGIDTALLTRCQRVSRVSSDMEVAHSLTPLTPLDTATKTTCQDSGTPRKPNEYKGLAHGLTPLTPLTPQKHTIQEIDMKSLNDLFRFDLVQTEIEAGHSESELRRVNNMAYVFMRDDQLTLGEAMKAAAEIVVSCPVAPCELTYPDVMEMWRGELAAGSVPHAINQRDTMTHPPLFTPIPCTSKEHHG
ncbi:hypothetical protein BH11PSE12_BH11PSE12_04010 [soil metagenome]